jgi:hypothetical protein
MAKRPTNTTRLASRSQAARDPITLERATALCPNSAIAANIARHFALEPVDYAAVREAHEEAIGRMANAFGETLGEKATAMHFQRLVGALVTSAFNAARFYGDKVTEARDLTAKLQNDDRDEDREGVWGSESKAQRARRFAGEMGLQAYAQLAAAEGAVDAYGTITGETWKPYVGPADNTQSVDRQAAAAELEAFGE